MEKQDEDIFQALENRHDLEFSRPFEEPNHDIFNQRFSRLDGDGKFSRLDSDGKLDSLNQFDDNTNKDPLYIVHFVPTAKPESSTTEPDLTSTVSSDVLQKILSASKGAKPGTPQFVVFAPIPGEEDRADGVGTLKIGSQGLNPFPNKHFMNDELDHKDLDEDSEPAPFDVDHQKLNNLVNQIRPNDAIDYDYEEELRKYQELLGASNNPHNKRTSRVGKSKETSDQQEKSESRKLSVKEITRIKNVTAQNVYNNLAPSPKLQPNSFNPHQLLALQQAYQQSTQGRNPTYQQSAPQGYVQKPPQHVQQASQHVQYPAQQYAQQPSQQAQQSAPSYFQQQQQPDQQDYQTQASDRSGQYEPIGIKLNFGGPGGGLSLGGGYSPLGIIGSILKQILPRQLIPRVNLNGKVMFGVMLEKGLKLGDRGNDHG